MPDFMKTDLVVMLLSASISFINAVNFIYTNFKQSVLHVYEMCMIYYYNTGLYKDHDCIVDNHKCKILTGWFYNENPVEFHKSQTNHMNGIYITDQNLPIIRTIVGSGLTTQAFKDVCQRHNIDKTYCTMALLVYPLSPQDYNEYGIRILTLDIKNNGYIKNETRCDFLFDASITLECMDDVV